MKAGDVFFREGPEEMKLEVLPGHLWWTSQLVSWLKMTFFMRYFKVAKVIPHSAGGHRIRSGQLQRPPAEPGGLWQR